MPAAASFDSFQAELGRLVEVFGRNLAHYKSPGYDEASLRNEFLNPFFRALGWDVENLAGHIPRHREVEIESRTQIGGRQKRADYLFRTDTRDRFVCEAKKPAEELHSRYAFQAKRYAWNKDLPFAILTDFEEIKLYVVGGKPRLEEPLAGEFATWKFTAYTENAQELWNLLSREKVAAGSIDALLDSLPKARPTGKGKARQQWLIKPDRSRALDTDFLEFLDEARKELASDLYSRNDHDELLEDNKLNEAVQRILDRILFLRICEDRDIDTGVTLQSIVETWRKNYGEGDEGRRARQRPLELREEPPSYPGRSRGNETQTKRGDQSLVTSTATDSLWHAVVRHFRALDRRPPTTVPFFNGNLFKPHFSESLVVGDEWLAGFIGELSDDETPYLFNVIPVEILGSVYERFLGKVVRPHGRGITVEEKPEVRKAGGVYYTPRYIVDYIVEQTVGRLLDDIGSSRGHETHAKREDQSLVTSTATLKEMEKRTAALRVLDPACGSGSFLIRAFERVCEHWQKWLTEDLRRSRGDETQPDPSRTRREEAQTEKGDQRLLTSSPTQSGRSRGDETLTERKDQRLLTSSPTVKEKEWKKKHRPLCWVDDATGDVHLTVDLKRRILTQNIYGVDLDAAAVEVTQLSLYLKMLEDENRTTLERERELFAEAVALLPPLQDNIKCGNSLIASDFSMIPEDLVRVRAFDWPVQFAEIMRAGGFDAVIGNPPWGQKAVEWSTEEKAYIKDRYRTGRGILDLFKLFCDRSIQITRPGGRWGMVLPDIILLKDYPETRRLLLENTAIEGIAYTGMAFADAQIDSVCLVCLRQPSNPETDHEVGIIRELTPRTPFRRGAVDSRLPQALFWRLKDYKFNIHLDPPRLALLERLEKFPKLGDYFEAHEGIHSGNVRAKLFLDEKANQSCRKLIFGRDEVGRYYLAWGGKWVNYHDRAFNKAAGEYANLGHPCYFEPPKVFVRRTGDYVMAVFDDGGYYASNNLFVVLPKDDVRLHLKTLTSLLNSRLLTWYFRTIQPRVGKVFAELKINQLHQFPLPPVDVWKAANAALTPLGDKLTRLVAEMKTARTEPQQAVLQNAIAATEQALEKVVSELYALTAEESVTVAGSTPEMQAARKT